MGVQETRGLQGDLAQAGPLAKHDHVLAAEAHALAVRAGAHPDAPRRAVLRGVGGGSPHQRGRAVGRPRVAHRLLQQLVVAVVRVQRQHQQRPAAAPGSSRRAQGRGAVALDGEVAGAADIGELAPSLV